MPYQPEIVPSEVGTTNTSWKPVFSPNFPPQKAVHLLARCRCLWTRCSGKEATCTGYNCTCAQLTWPLDTWWRVTSCTLNHTVIANTTKQAMNTSGVNTQLPPPPPPSKRKYILYLVSGWCLGHIYRIISNIGAAPIEVPPTAYHIFPVPIVSALGHWN